MPTTPQMRQTCTALLAALTCACASVLVPGAALGAANFHIRGGGDGHGIGMSQYGAYGYALRGFGDQAILAHYYQGTALGLAPAGATVRVLLSTGAAGFSGATAAGGHKLDPATTYTVKPNADGTVQLSDSKHDKLPDFTAPLRVTGPGALRVAGLGSYRGALQFQPDGSGGVDTVNAIGLEDYVRGVISEEMPSSWAAATLQVQAVAARTYAITTRAGGPVFDQYADTRSQMYGGVGAETPATDAAVAATTRQVVTFEGTPVVTYFSSSSGGHTENVENVWTGMPADPWLRGVRDPYDGAGGNPYHSWRRSLSLSAAARRLRGLVKGRFAGIEVIAHGVSPRVVKAAVVGTSGNTAVAGDRLRSAFGLLSIPSSFTTISTEVGTAATPPPSGGGAGANGAPLAMAEIAAQIKAFIAGIRPQLSGRVFPGARGARFSAQLRSGHSWRTVAAGRLRAGGTYAVAVPGVGTYRVLFDGMAGPAVTAR